MAQRIPSTRFGTKRLAAFQPSLWHLTQLRYECGVNAISASELELFLVDKNDTSWSLRPWLVLVHFGIPFRETSFIAADPATPARIADLSPTGKVPVLRLGSRWIWESLAIVETLAELHPEHAIWPRDVGLRMHARAVAAEMHAGFAELRRYCTMNLALRTEVALDPARRRELDRFEALVTKARAEAGTGGPFLFGEFCAADAMLAPIATRIRSYGLPVGPVTRNWTEAIFALPAFQRWEREAALERTERPPAERIGVPLQGTLEGRIPEAPCYAAIFSSHRRTDPSEYDATAEHMLHLAKLAPGYLGFESAREPGGFGITVSYWSSLEAIAEFRKNHEHQDAQQRGRDCFYVAYELRVARVERHSSWQSPSG